MSSSRQLRAAIFAAVAVTIVATATIVTLAWGSEDAISVEASSQAQAEAAMAAVDMPSEMERPSRQDGDQDVSFEEVVASIQSGPKRVDDVTESAVAVDSKAEVCADDELENLCRYASGEPIPTPTAIPTPTEAPDPTPTPRRSAGSAADRTTTRRAEPVAAATQPPRPRPVETTPVAPAPVTQAAVEEASTPAPVRPASTPIPRATVAPSIEPPAEPTVDSLTAESGEVVYIYTEPPSPDNPNPPVMECLSLPDGSLDCPPAT